MRTLTVEEAVAGLGKWLDLAASGEPIRIRKGSSVVELRPVIDERPSRSNEPREALQDLQREARLTPEEAEEYLSELRQERLAAEAPR